MTDDSSHFQNRRAGWLRQLRTLLSLARVSNLPTIWSNCLAGWWLGTSGEWRVTGGADFSGFSSLITSHSVLLVAGITALYLGGSFLNDAFDADFDRQHHPERPIPSSAISLPAVWSWGLAWLGLGAICLVAIGTTPGVLAIVFLVCIIIYDALHKVVTASPWLMGVCRFWIYVIAGSAASPDLNGWPIWCGVALGLYVAGLGLFGQLEKSRQPTLAGKRWALALLVAPFFLAILMNHGEDRTDAIWISVILILWLARCIRPMFQAGQKNVSRIVSGLVAGIVFVDWLAVAPECPHQLSAAFLALFGATLLLQRFVPAP